jgi:hypothetical protein
MGYSISWIAFHGKSRQQVLELLRLVDTDEADPANETPISGSELPGGWYALFLNDIIHPYLDRLGEFSRGCTVLGCRVEEHIMASTAFLYQDGSRVWNITHEAEKGIYNLEIVGSPPPSFSPLAFRQKQDSAGGETAGVDHMFDAPLQLAFSICGYRHDHWKFDWGEPSFTRLEDLGA